MKNSKKLWCITLVLFMVFNTFLNISFQQKVKADTTTNYYVALDGDDNNEGSIGLPFKTLEKARDTIRALKSSSGLPAGGVTVYVRGGQYQVNSSLALTDLDSGTADSPIAYKAYNNEPVSFIGGLNIEAGSFTTVTDSTTLQRIAPSAQDKILKYTLPSDYTLDPILPIPYGAQYSTMPENVFLNGKPMTLARWPNDSYAVIGENSTVTSSNITVKYTDNELSRLENNLTDVMVSGYWLFDWSIDVMNIASINTTNKTFTTAQPATLFGQSQLSSIGRYFVYNSLEELDIPGEWYIDRGTKELYIYPTVEMNTNPTIQLSRLKAPFVTLNGVSHVSFSGLTFEVARGNGIRMDNTRNVLVAGCTFRNIDATAIIINGGMNNGVQSCDLYSLGSGGISISGDDTRATLTAQNNFATNNNIYDFARILKNYNPGISLYGVGNLVKNNEIHNAPHSAILFGGNNNVIEYNNIYNVVQESSDAGAIYGGRNFTFQGNEIKYNFIHNIKGTGGVSGAQGVYLDDMLSGINVHGNVFYKVQMPVEFGGGWSNKLNNNIMIGNTLTSTTCFQLDGRGLAGSWIDAKNQLISHLNASPYKNDIWQAAYPDLYTLGSSLDTVNNPPVDAGNPNWAPMYNEVKNNVLVNGAPAASIVQAAKNNVKNAGDIVEPVRLDTDPGFAAAQNLDFAAPVSSVFNAGLITEDINFSQIGCYLDSYRSVPAYKDGIYLGLSNIVISKIYPSAVNTYAETAPVLPTSVTVEYSDDSYAQLPVTWEPIDPASYAVENAAGFMVYGSVEGTAIKATALVKVLPKLNNGTRRDLNLGSYLAQRSNWVKYDGTNFVSFDSNNNLQILPSDTSVGYAGEKFQNDVLLFKMTSNIAAGEAMELFIRGKNPRGMVWEGNDGYSIWLKNNVIELQKWVTGSPSVMLKIVNTDIFAGAKVHEIAFGTVETSEGVNIVLNVDGEDVFKDESLGRLDFLDDDAPIVTPGYFRVGNYTKAAVLLAPGPGLSALNVTAETNLLSQIGQTLQLSVKGIDGENTSVELPDVVLQYTSSDPSVITVDTNGLLTAVGYGSATISVMAEVNQGQTIRGSLDIQVSQDKNAYATIQAESANALNGVINNGSMITNTNVSYWAKYSNVTFGTQAPYMFEANLAVPNEFEGGTMQIRLDSPTGLLIGSMVARKTGGWGIYSVQRTALENVTNVTGSHDIYITFDKSNTCNLDWFRFCPQIDNNGISTFVDEINDYTKMYSHPSEFVFMQVNNSGSMLQPYATNQSIVYKATKNMTEFRVKTYRWNGAPTSDMGFAYSEDGISYTDVIPARVTTSTGDSKGWANIDTWTLIDIPEGKKYLKISFTNDADHILQTVLDRVEIDTSEYIDNMDVVKNDSVVKYGTNGFYTDSSLLITWEVGFNVTYNLTSFNKANSFNLKTRRYHDLASADLIFQSSLDGITYTNIPNVIVNRGIKDSTSISQDNFTGVIPDGTQYFKINFNNPSDMIQFTQLDKLLINTSDAADITPPAAPTITKDITYPTKNDVVVTILYPKDAVVKEYKIGQSETWTAYTSPIVMSSNGIIYARGSDEAGNVSDETSLVINNIVKNIPSTFIDDIDDYNKMYSHPTEFVFIQINNNGSMLQPYATNQSIVYKTIKNMTEFRVKTYRWVDGSTSDMEFAYSADGSTYTTVTPVKTTSATGDLTGWANIDTWVLSDIPAGQKYLKVTFTNGADNILQTVLDRVEIDTAEYIDNMDSLVNDSVVTYYPGSFMIVENSVLLTWNQGCNITYNLTSFKNLNSFYLKTQRYHAVIPSDLTLQTSLDGVVYTDIPNVAVIRGISQSVITQDYFTGMLPLGTKYFRIVFNANEPWETIMYTRTDKLLIDTSNIDNITLAANTTEPTNQNVSVSINYSSDSVAKEYKIGDAGTWTAYTEPVELAANDTVYARATDSAGNISSEASLIVSNIDKIAPTAEIDYSATTSTTQDVIATLIPSEPITVTNNEGVNNYTFYYNGSFTFEFVDAVGNKGTATATVNNIISKSKAKPGKPTISDNNGYDTGLLDGNYNVTMNMWNGNNGRLYKLYENDVLIDTKILTDNSPKAQVATTTIKGKVNGTYSYYCTLTNAFGTTKSSVHTVTVKDAAPGKPVLSNDNWDGDGKFKVSMNMWWGTNGTTYNLYENGILIYTKALTESTPSAQSVVFILENRKIGTYEYRAELTNYAGTTSSKLMIVKVTK